MVKIKGEKLKNSGFVLMNITTETVKDCIRQCGQWSERVCRVASWNRNDKLCTLEKFVNSTRIKDIDFDIWSKYPVFFKKFRILIRFFSLFISFELLSFVKFQGS